MFPNRTQWKSFSQEEIDQLVEDVFNHYRLNGFPYFPTGQAFRDNEFRKLIDYDGELLSGKDINQTMHGLSLAWSYMPHSWSVVCNNQLTPMDLFNDDELFRKVIAKRIKMGDTVTDNGIRKMMKMFTGAQAVSNFRPTAASALYEHFLPNGGKILDMSCGYGGRLLGAIRANHRVGNISYVGFDPCTPTVTGLKMISEDYGDCMDISIHARGSEFITGFDGQIDFAFTSPPYFDTERYSDEYTQSYKKYPTKELWLNEFMGATISNVRSALKTDCVMALNIANVRSYPTMCSDIIRLAENNGFILMDTFNLKLSNSTFKAGKSAYKTEPVYIFRKA